MSEPQKSAGVIFDGAIELPEEQRGAFVEKACAGDAPLRQRVEALLRAHEGAGTFMDNPAVAPGPEPMVVLAGRTGQQIGNYKLLEQIGEGGCGVVYLAEQREPVRRQVALKVIKLGLDTKNVIARFEAERQALALMDHPNIAKVLEAGATESGRPYFVMELVRGIPITDYCDQDNLRTAERLELFIQVCQAIQHAHQKGIIHRDIKPSNILVTMRDGTPVPKVIDFGIAKATQQRLTDKTLFTALQQFIGTPAYMSPEQAAMNELGIDTRSDIYSLGVLLYELLTGKTPFEQKELAAAGLDAMRRTILEREPPKPSTRLSAMVPDELVNTATRRRTEVPKLIHSLRGDLDWIVMKALEKDRTRRYETANGLARDLDRHLRHEPVTARPYSRFYEFQKTVRRHRVSFAATTAVLVALLVGLGVASWSLVQERKARSRAVGSEAKAIKEARRAEEALNASDLAQAVHLSAEGHAAEAIPYLVRILSAAPTNDAALTRLTTLLTYRSWMLPLVTVTQADWVVSAQFSPNGERLVTGSWDYTARVWNARTGSPVTPPLVHRQTIWSVEFSPDGRSVLTASADGTAQVWDAQTGQSINGPLQHAAAVRVASFSPDGRRVVTGSLDNTAQVWDALTGQRLSPPLRHSSEVDSVQFSPDGSRVLTASVDGSAVVWDAVTGARVAGPLRHGWRVISAQFSPDGKRIVTASYDGTARVWDAETGRPLTDPLRHGDRVTGARFSPNGRWVVTASYDKTARVWDATDGRPLTPPLQHAWPVASAEFSLDSKRVLTASGDGMARVWDAQSGELLGEPSSQGAGLWSARFNPDSTRIVTASRDNTAVVWDIRDRRPSNLPFEHQHWVRSAAFSPDGKRVVTTSNDKTARVWDALNGRAITGPLRHDDTVWTARFSPDCTRVVTASDDHTARLWDAQTGQALATLRHGDSVREAQFSPDGKWVVTASLDQTARIWDARTGLPRFEPLPHGSNVWCAQFSPDGQRIVTGCHDGIARLWDALSGKLLGQYIGHTREIVWAQFSPDGQRIVTASHDHTARLWDMHNGRQLTPALKHTDSVLMAEFSPDGAKILTASWDGTARVWDATTGLPLTQRLKHGQVVSGARFASNGRRIVTVSDDHAARIWDALSGMPLAEPFGHSGPVWTAEFSPDGKRVLTASDDQTARLWDLAPSGKGCPAWFLELAQAVSGLVISPHGVFEVVGIDRAEAINQVRQALAREPADDDWAVWGRWFLADPATRTISPFSKMTMSEYITRRLELTGGEAINEAQPLMGLGALESLCRQELANCRTRSPNDPDRWQSGLSGLIAVLQRQEKYVEAALVYADVLKPSGPLNLVINGSFEFGSFRDNTGQNAMGLLANSPRITGWTVTRLDLACAETPNTLQLTGADGSRFLNLCGSHDRAPYAGISQTIPTTVGRDYKVSFAVGSDKRWAGEFHPAVEVGVTGAKPTLWTVTEAGTNRWETFEFTFTAAATNTTLTFTGAATNAVAYIGLDNVRVTPVLPETNEPRPADSHGRPLP
jgi:WD40 repeat protein/serine/threonine protein kinase